MEFTATINERIDSLNARLDEVEEGLPAVPKAAFRLNRAVTERMIGSTSRVGTAVIDTFEDISEAATKTYKSIAKNAPEMDNLFDSAQKFAEDTVEFASTGVKQVAGQFGIAFDKVETGAEEATTKVAKTMTKAAKTVEKSELKAEKVDLSKKTKAELYEMAKDLDIDGRATMSKGQLVKALAKA